MLRLLLDQSSREFNIICRRSLHPSTSSWRTQWNYGFTPKDVHSSVLACFSDSLSKCMEAHLAPKVSQSPSNKERRLPRTARNITMNAYAPYVFFCFFVVFFIIFSVIWPHWSNLAWQWLPGSPFGRLGFATARVHLGSLAWQLPVHLGSLAWQLPVHLGGLAWQLPVHLGGLAWQLPSVHVTGSFPGPSRISAKPWERGYFEQSEMADRQVAMLHHISVKPPG